MSGDIYFYKSIRKPPGKIVTKSTLMGHIKNNVSNESLNYAFGQDVNNHGPSETDVANLLFLQSKMLRKNFRPDTLTTGRENAVPPMGGVERAINTGETWGNHANRILGGAGGWGRGRGRGKYSDSAEYALRQQQQGYSTNIPRIVAENLLFAPFLPFVAPGAVNRIYRKVYEQQDAIDPKTKQVLRDPETGETHKTWVDTGKKRLDIPAFVLELASHFGSGLAFGMGRPRSLLTGYSRPYFKKPKTNNEPTNESGIQYDAEGNQLPYSLKTVDGEPIEPFHIDANGSYVFIPQQRTHSVRGGAPNSLGEAVRDPAFGIEPPDTGSAMPIGPTRNVGITPPDTVPVRQATRNIQIVNGDLE